MIAVKAQDVPDYPERSLQQQTKLQEASETESIFAGVTEGSINPAEYFVGPGDNIFISITGVKQLSYNLSINQEGWIFVPLVGGINLNNLTRDVVFSICLRLGLLVSCCEFCWNT